MFELKERQRRIEEEEEAARQIALEEERQRQREREERERQEAEAAREREERRSATEELRQSTGKERGFCMGGIWWSVCKAWKLRETRLIRWTTYDVRTDGRTKQECGVFVGHLLCILFT